MRTLIEMKSVKELNGYKFTIPNYQRGYRWTSQQVKELLDDVWEFLQNHPDETNIYCIQPLVVCEKSVKEEERVAEIRVMNDWKSIRDYVKNYSETWEVIDGQQRLTTISIIIQMFTGKAPYSISYDTLKSKEEKINNIGSLSEEDAKQDINLHFMYEAKKSIENWQQGNKDHDAKKKMVDTINNRVKFIWYVSNDNPISVFTRLNVGRIALTASELIKALFLNRENFSGNSDDIIRSRQTQIAQEWDSIENHLQNDEFWLFLRNLNKKNNNDSWNKPTRIDFLLDFLCDSSVIKEINPINGKDYNLEYDDKIVGNDKYRTFRIYNECYKQKKENFLELWLYIKEIFDIWQEWYNNSELYHYTGYLLTENAATLKSLTTKWIKNTKNGFIEDIKKNIKSHLKNCQDLERDYFTDGKDSKRDCIPLLLLHNVETIVRQNRVLTKNEKYKLGVFHKFPFHLYKIESWDVEHIDSATENELSDTKDQQEWVLSAYQCLSKEKQEEFKEKLNRFFNEDKDNEQEGSNAVTFEEIYKEFSETLELKKSNEKPDDWKNKVHNYVLLDSSTNRNYKNAIFPAKRGHIVGKEKGVHNIAIWNEKKGSIETISEEFKSAFVPVCTKNVFQKTYSTIQGDPTVWGEEDALAYKNELEETLKEFLQ